MTLLFLLGFLELGIIAFVLVGLVLNLATIIDIVKSEFKNQNDKLIWILIVVFIHFIGAILYFAVGRNQRINRFSN
jgi:hypothetical protein